MTFAEVIDKFISNIEEDKAGGTSVTYKRKIYVFQEYVELVLQAKDVNYQSILTAMTKEQLLDSIEYYVKTYDVKYVTTVETFYSVLGIFFDFISLKYEWKNPVFETRTKNLELKAAYDEKISKLKLNTKEQVEPLTDQEASELINICDNNMDNATIDKLRNGANNGDFSSYISSLVSKVVLLYGTKNGCLNEIKISDYDCRLNKLNINGFWVHLPDKLAIQMREYIKYREKLLNQEKEKRLFIDIRKGKRKLDNTKMFYILKGVTGNTQGKSIAKYAIIQMIKLGVPSHMIKEFTGYSDDVYRLCQEKYEQDGILMALEKSKLMDSALRRSDLFDRI
ncbi:MAG: hypothetical protein HFH62_03120 [Lachnospiraceae bacterium]|nr:hypothetical protein [Lachnospiraceae bacterium]